MTIFCTARRGLTALALALTALGASAATGDVATYVFNSTAVGAFGVGPYGTVKITDTGTGVDFSIGLRSDMDFVNTGGPHSVFSFNALGVATTEVSNILFNGAAVTGYLAESPGGNQPFGIGFSLMIDCSSCGNGAGSAQPDPLTFSVANAELGDFGFLATGTTAMFAADVICTTGSCNGSTGAIGAVPGDGNPPPGRIPEPGSLALAGLGLFAAGMARRRMVK